MIDYICKPLLLVGRGLFFCYTLYMTRKKIIGIVLLIAGFGVAAWGVNFYNKNLRGAAPALLPPSGDIVAAINTTDMPLKLPPGFAISIFAKDLGSPRVITRDPAGTILASIPQDGKIVALPDKNFDGKADETITVISGLNDPHGMAWKCDVAPESCVFYVAEENALASYDYDTTTMKASNRKKLADINGGGNHTSRTLLFEPMPNQDKLLVSIGSTCNVCDEENAQRAKIFEYDTVTGSFTEFAKGLRNAPFMALHPVTGDVWATEMGRDQLGDDIPPDEINIVAKGKNYGWPICYGQNIHDTQFDKKTYIRNPCMEPFETPAHIDIQAHSAPLGLAFFGEETWPQIYWYNMLVAYHGSWNRTEPTGYKIVRYKLDAKGNVLGSEDFITGWLKDGQALGRPVDIMIEPGKIYITDDKAGVIYLVKYMKE